MRRENPLGAFHRERKVQRLWVVGHAEAPREGRNWGAEGLIGHEARHVGRGQIMTVSQVRISVSYPKSSGRPWKDFGVGVCVCVTLLELCFKMSFLGLPWRSSG